MDFEVTVRDHYAVVQATVNKLDTNCAPDLKAQFVLLNKEGVKNIILDLSKTRYADSSGLSAILVGNRLCNGAEGTFVLCGLQDMVMKLIEISQLMNILNIVPTLDEAVDYITMEEVQREIGDE